MTETVVETIVITRHAALAAYLVEIGAVPSTARVIPHASAEDIRGRHVAGPLPLHLAALAASVIHVPLDIPAELRGVELTLDQVRALARPVERYTVTRLAPRDHCMWCGADNGPVDPSTGRGVARAMLGRDAWDCHYCGGN